jgi:uncharacterized protein (TIGR02266 family)
MGAGERRDFGRVPVPFAIRYRVYGQLGESWHEIATINISAGGMRFRTDDPIEVGSHLELEIALPGSPAPLVVQGKVVWNQALGARASENGVQFMEMTPDQHEHIDSLVRFLMKKSPPPTPPS